MWDGYEPDNKNQVSFAFTIAEDFTITVTEIREGQCGDFGVETAISFDKDAGTISMVLNGQTLVFSTASY